MGAYIIRRLLWTPVLLVVVSFITFVLCFYGPGDPVQILLSQYRDPQIVERIREQQGLDKPLLLQYGMFVGRAVKGDLGQSFKYRGTPVAELIGNRMLVSVQLGLAGMAMALLVGIPSGLLAAVKQGKWQDTAIIGGALFFNSLPVFLTAPVLMMIFVLWLGVLPSQGWGGLFDARIILPALVIGIPGVAFIARMTRNSTVEVLAQDYVRTARAKGLPNAMVYTRHVLRNSMIPVFTIVGLGLASLVTGAIITETYFGIPGIGRLTVESFFARDYPVIMAISIIIATAYVVANLIVDIGYRLLDPRIRYD